MRILISPTAFKGTLTPSQATRLLSRGVRQRFPSAHLTLLPLADGGDGTLDVLFSALGGKKMKTRVEGPLGTPVQAHWLIVQGRMAVIEMARASGLALVKGKNRIMEATSTGTGQLIRAALDQGCRKILIGAGGTACGEGGAGALRALGLRYLDARGHELSAKPVDLTRLKKVDASRFDQRILKTKLIVLCDVKNPLLGPQGSARTFGPQKGATPHQVRLLERYLKRWSSLAPRKGKNKKGAGAAGALAFGLAAYARAQLAPGTPFVMKLLNWARHASRSDLIISGEGRLDKTSFQGKVIGEILKHRGRARIVLVCGSSALSRKEEKAHGLDHVIPLKEFV